LESSKQNVLIIGGSGGLGNELSRTFHRNGDRVAIHYFKNRENADFLLNKLGYSDNSDEAFTCYADIREEKSVEQMFETVRSKWTHLDIVVNSGGITEDSIFSRMTIAQWQHTIQVNLYGFFFCMKHAAEWMITQQKGHIINIASRAGVTGRVGQANYAASKAGVIALTKTASREWGNQQIQVNAIMPGFLFTRLGSKTSSKNRNELVLENALQKSSTITEVSQFIFQLSRMRHVSGQIFNLDSRII